MVLGPTPGNAAQSACGKLLDDICEFFQKFAVAPVLRSCADIMKQHLNEHVAAVPSNYEQIIKNKDAGQAKRAIIIAEVNDMGDGLEVIKATKDAIQVCMEALGHEWTWEAPDDVTKTFAFVDNEQVRKLQQFTSYANALSMGLVPWHIQATQDDKTKPAMSRAAQLREWETKS